MQDYELVIIGAGPAGMTAGIYAKRAGIKALMIEEGAPGGKLIKTDKIENYPSIEEMGGVDLAMKMFDHTQKFDLATAFSSVKEIVKTSDGYLVKTSDEEYQSKTVIIATGTKERLLNIPGEKEFTGKGVSYCAVCDGFFYRNKKVAVIGGGNSALQEALYLSQFAEKLYVVIRRDVFRADQVLVDKVLNNPKIEVIKKSIPLAIEGEEKVARINLKNVDSEEIFSLDVDGVFPYIGAIPCTEFASNLAILDERGYIEVNNEMETKLEGLYAAGDCTAKYLRQVITACSDGAIAAQKVATYLNEK